jgi:DNA-binding SARP family transcriptional activator
LVRYGVPIVEAGIHADALRRSDRIGAAVDITLAALVAIGGLLWCLSVWWFIAIAVAEVRGSNPLLPFAGPLRPLLLRAVGAISLLVIQPTRVPPSAVAAVTAADVAPAPPPANEGSGHEIDLVQEHHELKWVLAGPRDSWVTLAERHLGSWRRWDDIKVLQPEPQESSDDGQAGPRAGQVIVLPANARGANEGPLPVLDAGNPPTGVMNPGPLAIESAHHVAPGESFWQISEDRLARAYGRTPTDAEVDRYHDEMIGRNRDRLADPANPDLIFPAQELVTPALHSDGHGNHGGAEVDAPMVAEPPDRAISPPETTTELPRADPTPSTATAAGSEPSGARPTTPSESNDEPAGNTTIVRVPSGSTVGATFVAGALFGHWIAVVRRRRAYRPSDPQALRARRDGTSETDSVFRRVIKVHLKGTGGHEAEAGPVPWVRARDAAPLRVEVGATAASSPIEFDAVSHGLTTLTGPGAEEFARAVVVSTLLRCPASDLRVLVDASTAEELFGSTLPSFPGLDVVAQPGEVLDEIQTERVQRSRIIDSADVNDFAAYRAAPTDELLAALLVVSRPADEDADRWADLIDGGSRLGIGAILLGGGSVGGSAIDVAADGTVVSAGADSRHLEGAELYRLTEADSSPILWEIAEARTLSGPEEPDIAPRVEPFPVDAVISTIEARVRLRLFGPMTIEVGAGPIRTGLLDKAREFCAYLTLHPEGVRRERALEDIWGDVDIDKRQDRFSAAVSSLRRCLRTALRAPDVEVVCCEGDRYFLQEGLFNVDLWRFQTSLAPTDDDVEVGERLRDALTAYRGEFVQDAPWEWVEDHRESLRRQALNAAVKLAVKEQLAGRIEEAISVVDHAIETIDPYAEHLYVRGVELLVAADRIESAQALYDRLKSRLERLRDEPMPDTVDAIGELLADGRRLSSLRRTRSETPVATET